MVKRKQKKTVATQYNWNTVYHVIKASSDRAVQKALKRFGVDGP
jgi:hypothetical protein